MCAAHKAYIVIQCDPGRFYIDHVVPFGITSGTGLQGAVMDAVVDIMDGYGWGPNLKWVDDLCNFRLPTGRSASGEWCYGHDLVCIFQLAGRLGIPWHSTKTTDYAFIGTYLGFLWDLTKKMVSLPEKKRHKYLQRVEAALSTVDRPSARMDLKMALKLNGTLSHITFVYPHGRAYLTNLCGFIASFTNVHAPRYPPKSLLSDLRWWQDVLRRPAVGCSLKPRGARRDLGIWVDASTDWGIGVVLEGSWDAWRWAKPLQEWRTEGRDIGWAEMVAIELAVRRLEEIRIADANILVRSDNEGVVGAVKRGRSRNFHVNLSIRRAETICMANNIMIQVEYVKTDTNVADSVSRGKPDAALGRFHSKFELPVELSTFLLHE